MVVIFAPTSSAVVLSACFDDGLARFIPRRKRSISMTTSIIQVRLDPLNTRYKTIAWRLCCVAHPRYHRSRTAQIDGM
ncbi:hypothetical protein B0T22DRAFT_434 [Podospora appendiculata]|uniref:Uncharacterized protein n=1 Tax=Podospora appendiculata TaxID=314037 RepID=A0AAE0XEU3_9PEZI|nr:hypothetical protein B0T22DRAFT_434 [Podospora appendiculata]